MSLPENKRQNRLPQFHGSKPNSKGKKPKVPPLKQQNELLKLEKVGLQSENNDLTKKLESMTSELNCYRAEDMIRIQSQSDQVYISNAELLSWDTRISEYQSEIERLNKIVSKPVEEPISQNELPKYPCEVCEIEFDKLESLNIHILNDHYRTLYESFCDERKEKENFERIYKETLAEYKSFQNMGSNESNEASSNNGQEFEPLEITHSTSENGILIMFYKKHITR